MTGAIWVLGATGRVGRPAVERLRRAGAELVVTGRDRERLARVSAGARVVAGSLDEVCARLAAEEPAVVVNTVGPFAVTGPQVVRACPPGTHYVDVADELSAFELLHGMDQDAVATGRTLVSGAGFGVLATEAILLHLLAGREKPARVRVDAVASVATEPGALGEALAATIVSSLLDGGREVRQDRLVRTRAGRDAERLTTPEGDVVTTAALGTGELFAAWQASGAPSVIGASALAPANPVVRAAMPALGTLLRLPGLAGFVTRRLARVTASTAEERPRRSSWGRARVEWPSGQVREGWLRTGEAMAFTVGALTEVALRLSKGEGRPGAFTPARLFGPDVALAAGAEFVTDPGDAGS
ncbi:saccharopine dehydrogenase NADP-binding domain-containing protein [Amycolatopsis sp. PS_44_ISF1]|uniref:saccharopine dehydrogenase NADP-binding domain-containing protein n=1 Tax=Amycolatopsis sp. PS_44_ISF1 TaxID=2974917 RepID=UPI0028DE22B6|nr:saccharopine dehydrogenase NADP-binding domain-containing protein [Amycolatopsis sp. PS_44_ISF1]MDT8912154.1 saccharopine dehydrogenase NADP-binding domain-containing protein [Amycolatopsis sp. PS_44_ISF1]